jgi:hypothetical protein
MHDQYGWNTAIKLHGMPTVNTTIVAFLEVRLGDGRDMRRIVGFEDDTSVSQGSKVRAWTCPPTTHRKARQLDATLKSDGVKL